MKLKDPLFYAKILLFGEYSIIEDSMGLSIPYNFYQGRLKSGDLNDKSNKRSNDHLRKYYNHLQELKESGTIKCQLDLDRFGEDIDSGLFFDSNIPQGFGVVNRCTKCT